jgi:hypothetical protein
MFDQDGPSSAAVVMSAVSRTSGYREYGKLEESSLRERLGAAVEAERELVEVAVELLAGLGSRPAQAVLGER